MLGISLKVSDLLDSVKKHFGNEMYHNEKIIICNGILDLAKMVQDQQDKLHRRNKTIDALRREIGELKKKLKSVEGGLYIHNDYLEKLNRQEEFNQFLTTLHKCEDCKFIDKCEWKIQDIYSRPISKNELHQCPDFEPINR